MTTFKLKLSEKTWAVTKEVMLRSVPPTVHPFVKLFFDLVNELDPYTVVTHAAQNINLIEKYLDNAELASKEMMYVSGIAIGKAYLKHHPLERNIASKIMTLPILMRFIYYDRNLVWQVIKHNKLEWWLKNQVDEIRRRLDLPQEESLINSS